MVNPGRRAYSQRDRIGRWLIKKCDGSTMHAGERRPSVLSFEQSDKTVGCSPQLQCVNRRTGQNLSPGEDKRKGAHSIVKRAKTKKTASLQQLLVAVVVVVVSLAFNRLFIRDGIQHAQCLHWFFVLERNETRDKNTASQYETRYFVYMISSYIPYLKQSN